MNEQDVVHIVGRHTKAILAAPPALQAALIAAHDLDHEGAADHSHPKLEETE